MVITGPDGVIRYANALSKKFLGQGPKALFGLELDAVLQSRGFSEDGTRRGENVDLIRFPVPVPRSHRMRFPPPSSDANRDPAALAAMDLTPCRW